MSIDEQVHTAPAPPADPDGREAPDGHNAGGGQVARELASLVMQTAVSSVTVVGRAVATFGNGSRQWLEPARPRPSTNGRGARNRPEAPEAPEAKDAPATPRGRSDGRGRISAPTSRRRRSAEPSKGWSTAPASPATSPRTAAPVGRAVAGVAALRRKTTAERPSARPAVTFPTVDRDGRPVGRGPDRRAPSDRPARPALPLPANPAAPRPQLTPEDDRPLVVKLGTLLIGAVAGAAAIVVVIGAIVPRASADMREVFNIDVILPQDVDLAGLEQPSRVYASDGTLLAELRAEVDREVVPLSDIPEHVRDAVIASEDRSFYEHNGYSIEGIGRALLTNLRTQDVSQGGSTLTQQLAKMNFVGDEVTLDRKITELFYAMKLEEEFTKDELLERYLNEVYFGVSAYGIQAAAHEYYGVDVEELRVDQAALLAGVIPRPSAYNPRVNPERALERRDQVLQDMFEIGAITEAERDAAVARPLDVVEHAEQEVREPYVIAAVKRLFLDDPAFGATRQEREDKLFRGNLDITTTLDPELQEIAEETIDAHFGGSDGPTASIATVDPQTGAILAFASGQEFDSEQFDYALQGRQQPGSAFKTFVLGAALRDGFSPDLVLNGNSPLEVTYDEGRRTYEPQNYGGADYGEIDMTSALRRSVNTYFVQLFEVLGREPAVELAGELGIDVPEAIGSSSDYGPSLVLGGLKAGLTPLEMAGAYATFANGGVFHEPHLIKEVVDGDGTELLTRSAGDGREVFSPEVNAVIVDIMEGVTAPGGTASGATVPGWDTAGKTGTTNDNTDAWFAGYTPALSTAVWVGYPDADVTMPGATGGGTAAPVWTDYMRRAHEDLEVVDFPDVDVDYDELFEGEEIEVPDVRGEREAEALRILAEHKLVANTVDVNSSAPQGQVIGVSPQPGSTVRQGEQVSITVSTGVAPAPPPPPPSQESGSDDDEDEGNDEGNDEGDGNNDGGGDGATEGQGGGGNGGGGNGGGGGGNGGGGGGGGGG